MQEKHLSNYRFVQDTSGELAFPLTNDYMFRATLQTSPAALRGLVAALMGMNVEDIYSCEITNPIVLGESIHDKYSVLDIRLVLNNFEKINLEMQVVREEAWPEFFSEYLMMNAKNGHVYSRNFSIRVLDLTQMECVGEDEKQSALYAWARFFKAKEWEEVQELAKECQEICEAAAAMKTLSADEKIKQQCWDRDLYLREKATHENRKRKLDEKEKNMMAVEKRLEEDERRLAEREALLMKKITLVQLLANDRRFDDLARLAEDSEQNLQYMKNLIAEYNL